MNIQPVQTTIKFDGAEVTRNDNVRLSRQYAKIRDYMLDGEWRTIEKIAFNFGYSECSVSAQLRNLRKSRFGSFTVNRRRRTEGSGLWEYQVVNPTPEFNKVLGAVYNGGRS